MRTNVEYWQVTQIFLSETGVHEVEVHNTSSKLRCNCSGFDARRTCKHTRYVNKKMNDNGGIYPTEVSRAASKLDLSVATKDPKLFRQLLIDYGKIEVI